MIATMIMMTGSSSDLLGLLPHYCRLCYSYWISANVTIQAKQLYSLRSIARRQGRALYGEPIRQEFKEDKAP